ncbi:hypothetical protein [Amphibacillus cookii]|uniref:hypothetical protein n=1 Tax=Amphibacillus cookii TaxID=767787 RepID=UPI001956619C|nr:hypothetical protein [Amphibacillus cookii]MBM7541664.1 hypothetical protein [Amphibacillus cookii]
MKMKIIKFLVVLTAVLVGLAPLPIQVFAQDQNVFNYDYTDFQLNESTDDYIEYEFNHEGSKYKAREEFDIHEDETIVSSEFFKLNDEGVYSLEKEITTVINSQKQELNIMTTENEKVTNEILSFDEVIKEEIEIENESTLSDESHQDNNFTIFAHNPGGSGVRWEYSHTIKTSNKFKKITVAVVAATLAAALVPGSTIVTASISALASNLVSEGIERVWYKIKVYYKHLGNVKIGERRVTTLYTDSYRKNKVPVKNNPITQITMIKGYEKFR